MCWWCVWCVCGRERAGRYVAVVWAMLRWWSWTCSLLLREPTQQGWTGLSAHTLQLRSTRLDRSVCLHTHYSYENQPAQQGWTDRSVSTHTTVMLNKVGQTGLSVCTHYSYAQQGWTGRSVSTHYSSRKCGHFDCCLALPPVVNTFSSENHVKLTMLAG